MPPRACVFCVFFFNDTATTEIYTLSLHDALPISFLGGNSHRQELEGQTISHAKGVVSVAPFILPPVGSLSLDELEMRSEEHTSELQSQSNLVCRLLLEKKKKRRRRPTHRLCP